MASACSDDFIAFANRLADASGEIIRLYFRSKFKVDQKVDGSPVTIADREVESSLRSLIHSTYPNHGIIGEEIGSENLNASYVWVIDPIDGTKAFISGLPLFGTLIALTYRGRAILGVIDQPITGERWIGASGHPCRLDGMSVKARMVENLSEAVLFTTEPEQMIGAEQFELLAQSVQITRYGADCYAFGLLASGFVDLAIERNLQVHDYMALIPVVESAGGVITDWRGRELNFDSDGTVIASGNAVIHQKAIDLLQR